MSSFAATLKTEISRQARRELRDDLDALRKSNGRYRSEIATLKRRLQALETTMKAMSRQLEKTRTSGGAAPVASTGQKHRFSPVRLKKMRERFQVSAPLLASILGISAQTVYNWEAGSPRPNPEQITKIALLAKMSPAEFRRRLAAWLATDGA